RSRPHRCHEVYPQDLAPLLRRLPSVEGLIPVLYLKGVSIGDFSETPSAMLGEGAAGLSATNIVHLSEICRRTIGFHGKPNAFESIARSGVALARTRLIGSLLIMTPATINPA